MIVCYRTDHETTKVKREKVSCSGLMDFIRELSQFCFICIASADIAQSICRENFHSSSKICENRKVTV